MPDNPKRSVIYGRTSPKPEHKAEESHSIETQLSMCRAYCKRKGYEVIDSFTDPERSGGDPDREGLANAINAVPRGGTLVVEKMDRVARDIIIEESVIGLLRAKQAVIETVAGDTAGGEESPERELLRQMMAVINKFQRRATAARTSARMRQLQADGYSMGAPPYGHRAVARGTRTVAGRSKPVMRLVPHPGEQKVIVAIQALRALDWGYRRIASHLSGVGFTNRQGKPIDKSLVQRVCEREEAAGEAVA